MIHPLTGEVFEDGLPALVAAEARVDAEAQTLYRFRRQLRETIADLRGVAILPPPRRQTDIQRRVASCPRCGSTASGRAA